ncbi:MAG: glycoside hydrolase family 9 protein [Cyanobacteria bacterium J06592_8]
MLQPITVDFSVIQDWGWGFTGTVALTNLSNKAIEEWDLEFEAPFEISDIWNAEITDQQDQQYQISNADWNATIPPKSTIEFGFNGRRNEIDPVDITLETPSSEPINNYSTDFSVTEDWGWGFTGKVSLTNLSNQALEGWNIELDAPFEISQIWNAEISDQQGQQYQISNVDWNEVIQPGSSIEFGFNGRRNEIDLSNYLFNGQPTASLETPQLSINDMSVVEGDKGTTNLDFEVTLDRQSSEPITVNYSTDNGNAVRGKDYKRAAGTLTFNPGDISERITVPIIGDTKPETLEVFNLNLSDPENAVIVKSQGSGAIIDQDINPTEGFNYGEALQKSFLFYEAQRSGELPADNRIPWRGDSALSDGVDRNNDGDFNDAGEVNLTGGYYDAGDHIKFGLPMASSMTLLSWGVMEYKDAYRQSGQLDEALDAIKWGTDYILKAHVSENGSTQAFYGQVGDAKIEYNYWISPEEITMERPAFKLDAKNPGADLIGESAAALASGSIIWRYRDPQYAETLLDNAQQLYEFAKDNPGIYSDSIPEADPYYGSFSYTDELAWSATWLYKATGDESYLREAEDYYQQIGGLADWTHNWDNKSYGSAVLLAQETGRQEYHNDVEEWLDYWSDDSGSGIQYTDGGLAWRAEWGSLRIAANTAFVAGVYSDYLLEYNLEDAAKAQRYDQLSEQQIDYILGDNPNNFSYMVGFGDNFPTEPHHRGASGNQGSSGNSPINGEPNQFILYGALVGGPGSPDDNDYVDERRDFVRNEVALDYNAGLTGALARMYDKYGGDPLTDTQIANLPFEWSEVNFG